MTHPKIYDRIEKRLDTLEELLKRQAHLSFPDTIRDSLSSLSKFRPYMNDEQSDFVDGARFVLEERIEWK